MLWNESSSEIRDESGDSRKSVIFSTCKCLSLKKKMPLEFFPVLNPLMQASTLCFLLILMLFFDGIQRSHSSSWWSISQHTRLYNEHYMYSWALENSYRIYMSLTSRIIKYKWHENVLKSTENIKTHGEKNKVCPIE